MSYEELVAFTPPLGKTIIEKLLNGRNCGFFSKQEAEERGVFFASGEAGFIMEGEAVTLYWLVDPQDGVVVDAKFQVFASSLLMAAADVVCDLLVGKNYDQARRLSVDLIEKSLKEATGSPPLPSEQIPSLNLLLEAIEGAASLCEGLPLSHTYISPLPTTASGEGYPGWPALSYENKIAVIERVLNEEVRPYVELDEGGIEVQKLINDRELIISYQGSCTSCYSAIGATLATIQQIVQAKVHPDLIVVPNLETLNFGK